jgi:hypothetical protein
VLAVSGAVPSVLAAVEGLLMVLLHGVKVSAAMLGGLRAGYAIRTAAVGPERCCLGALK